MKLRHATLTVREGFAFLASKLRTIHGKLVNKKSARYHVFRRSLVCAHCGIKGEFFALESHVQLGHRWSRKAHLNLYARLADGAEVLMTVDHIHPRSRGGANAPENLQTLCAPCNERKGNNLP